MLGLFYVDLQNSEVWWFLIFSLGTLGHANASLKLCVDAADVFALNQIGSDAHKFCPATTVSSGNIWSPLEKISLVLLHLVTYEARYSTFLLYYITYNYMDHNESVF